MRLAATVIGAIFALQALPASSQTQDYGVPVKRVVVGDINGDGIQDETILMDADCDTDGRCPWAVLIGGGEAQISGGTAFDISGTTWVPPESDANRSAIRADDVTWGIFDGAMFPVNDLIGSKSVRPGIANRNDADIVGSMTEFGPQDQSMMQIWRGDFMPDEGEEAIIVVPSAGSPLIGAPWFLVAGGAVIANGWSLDWPRVFRTNTGVVAISISSSGMSFMEIK